LRAQRTQAALPKSQSMDLIRPDSEEVTFYQHSLVEQAVLNIPMTGLI
jgi:hypothetical protein